jgi:F0F1-type ATP synthase delta subunit
MTDEVATKNHENFILPASLVSRVDVSHIVDEVERADNQMTAETIRAGEGKTAAIPVLSQQLTDFLAQNELTLADGNARAALIKELRMLKDKVPILHMTFAVNADPESLQQLAQWARTTIDPHAVIEVGLQPGLVAGVYLRTPNHVHDFSLRGLLAGKHDVLVNELGALRVK